MRKLTENEIGLISTAAINIAKWGTAGIVAITAIKKTGSATPMWLMLLPAMCPTNFKAGSETSKE